ncbi:MAG: 2-C-methyl-D-erythritol 2,4-cyclodiphosphate synthase [Acidobacteriota bacterium]
MRVVAIIAAGGVGERAAAGGPKQLVDLGGTTMLEMSLATLAGCPAVDEVVVAVPETTLAAPPAWLTAQRRVPVTLVPGGRRRQDTVARAFAEARARADVVVIHDAARPFASEALITRTVEAAIAHGAAIAALPVRDTVKRAGSGADARVIRATIPRDEVFLAQTPQAFTTAVLAAALDRAGGAEATDEAMLVEQAGLPVHLVEGEAANVKVTTPEDMSWARQRLAGALEETMRIGYGYDLHRLVPGRPLILGGVAIPFELGLDGHSDADIVCHAITDAILGAAAAGDIGRHFPDTDPRWKDADSVALLAGAVDVVRAAGYRVANVDATVIAQRPKLLPHVEAMRARLAAALGVDVARVSVKGKTNERVDSMGRGESMACHAVALLVRS